MQLKSLTPVALALAVLAGSLAIEAPASAASMHKASASMSSMHAAKHRKHKHHRKHKAHRRHKAQR